MKIKLQKNIFEAIKHVEFKLGNETLFKIEWLFSHYKNRTREDRELQTSIDTIVEYIKQSDFNRKKYFAAIVNGYDILTPEEHIKKIFDTSAIEYGELGCQLDEYTVKILTKEILNTVGIAIEGVNV